MSELNGVLPVDKPEGPTSHDVVAAARRALRLKRIGHTGTLDPFASGLLLLCLGPATRLAEYLTALPKAYEATMVLGVATDTDDRTGEQLRTGEGWREVTREDVERAARAQVGAILQRPPAYSAKKVAGERMYAAARRGEAPEVQPVEVTVEGLRVTRFAPPEVDFEVSCGSGTYIRAIARDIGEALGVGAHLSRLRRTRVGAFSLDRAVPLDALSEEPRVREALLSPAAALAHLPSITLAEPEVAAVLHGRPVAAEPAAPDEEPLALLSPSHELIAIGARHGGTIRPRKVFA